VSISRPRILGLLFPLLAATACTDSDPQVAATRIDVAVQSYAPDEGVPGWCATLAGSTHLTDIAAAIGTLTAREGDVEAKLALAAAVDDVRAVADEIAGGGQVDLAAAFDRLSKALTRAKDGPLTDASRAAVVTALDEAGRLVQPVCEFPL
jgi:hypothetical protein